MASQDARLCKFEADFKQQQGEMTNKIDTFLKAINDRMTGPLPSDTVKNPKLNINSTSPVLFARSYPMEDLQCSSNVYNSINAIKMSPPSMRIKSSSKLLSPKYQSQSSLGEHNRNSSSPKHVHFVNSFTILSKEYEPRDTRIVKPNTKNYNHDTIVKVEKESEESVEEVKEENEK
ncbi:hypothetical protein Tco_0861207 [Tanacetum coccineum]|uniref:Reverse transcriptase domain-containing protein n=1 Tax=Tanacetum coccineum TaxID=301880 RepID=A0ABQ5BH88_9ASTR